MVAGCDTGSTPSAYHAGACDGNPRKACFNRFDRSLSPWTAGISNAPSRPAWTRAAVAPGRAGTSGGVDAGKAPGVPQSLVGTAAMIAFGTAMIARTCR